ncbi:MAG TPA: PHP domain-containing protein [Anaerolineaceae bacterium]|nr:PHP domain-containing protein [Anaerolineaceae bacterium]
MLKVDFHTHTCYSKDSLTKIEDLITAARRRGLDRVVVTDHNTLLGALAAYAAAPDLIIPGEEIQTTEGEFLAAFVTREVPRGLEPMEALKKLKDQGAFISVSHPFDAYRSGWSKPTLERLAGEVDAIETFNARVIWHSNNQTAAQYAAAHGLAGTAGSDGHHPSEIGRAYSMLPEFEDAASLRLAIRSAQVGGRVSLPMVHFYSIWAKGMKKRSRIMVNE